MRALLLAAGFGTRLKPLTNKVPKPLIPLNGLPLIAYNLALLKKHKFKDIVINLHYLGQKIEDTLGDGSQFGLRLRYSYEKTILGTGGGIQKASVFFKNKSFLVMNSDILVDLHLGEFAQFHRSHRALASLVLIPKNEKALYGLLQKDKKDNLVSILSEPKVDKAVIDLEGHFSGIHWVNPSLFQFRKKKGMSCIIRDWYIPALRKGKKLKAMVYQGYWNDCGTLKSLEKTEKSLQRSQIKLSYQKNLNQMRKILNQ